MNRTEILLFATMLILIPGSFWTSSPISSATGKSPQARKAAGWTPTERKLTGGTPARQDVEVAGGAVGAAAQPIGRPPPPRRRGSRRSRSASPNMLKPKTAREIAAPGNSAIHGAWYMNERPEPESIPPHDG